MEVLGVESQSTVPHSRTRKRGERLFYMSMALVILVTVFAGFSRSYYLRSYFGRPELTSLLRLHGIVFTSWIVLYLVQTGLVSAHRINTHRSLGWAGAIIAVVMVVIGTATAITRAKVLSGPSNVSPLVFLTIPLGDMIVFPTLVAAAFWFRRRPAEHKRLMLLATIAILPAAIARLPFAFIMQVGPLAFFGLADLLIVACASYDLGARGRLNKATVLGGLLILVSQPLRLVIGGTSAWLAFAGWLTQ
jgi:hypothetical protein